jgi:hypothetical protein
MVDYTQHLHGNCGAIASIFALYGLNKVVPEELDDHLEKEWLPVSVIGRFINEAKNPQIRAEVIYAGGKISVRDYSKTPPITKKVPADFLDNLSSAVVQEGIKDVIDANNARCLICSCTTRIGNHWQTFYMQNKELKIYNSRQDWHPCTNPKVGPGGIVVVKGQSIS